MAEASAQEYLEVARTISSITELVLLDRFWTREAKALAGGDATARDARLPGLAVVAEQMERLLVDTELLGRRVAATGRRSSAQLDANFAALVADDGPLTSEQRTKVRELVHSRSGEDVAAFVAAAADDVKSQLEPERKHLQDELRRLSEGKGSEGDFTPEEERALAELAIAASIVFGPEAGVLVEAVGHLLDWLFG